MPKIKPYSKKRLRKIVTGTPRLNIKNGADAKFIAINDDWGVKFFTTKTEQEFNFDLQSKCAEHDLAPPVGRKLDFNWHGTHVFGYVTGICRIREDLDSNDFDNADDECDGYDFLYRVKRKLNLGLKGINLEWIDGHDANWGLGPNNQGWIIDFTRFAGHKSIWSRTNKEKFGF